MNGEESTNESTGAVVEPDTISAEVSTNAVDEPKQVPNAVKKRLPSQPGHVVSNNDVDEVRVSACVFKNPAAHKSLSVHHLQRRLHELGYNDAYTDKDGWYGDLTRKAVSEYQADNHLAGDGLVDVDTLEHLFSDDPNVVVVP